MQCWISSIFSLTRKSDTERLAGQKMGPGTIMRPFQKELNVVPVTMAYTELYGALERGIVDGLIQPWSL